MQEPTSRPHARRADITCMVAAAAATMPLLATGALAHTDKLYAPETGPAFKEQKEWGIAGDVKQAPRRIEVGRADNMRFTPQRIEVRQGETVKFVVRNVGKVAHEFVIGTQSENAKHADLMVKFPGMEPDEPYMAHVAPRQDRRDRLDLQPRRRVRVRPPDRRPLPGRHGGNDHGCAGGQGMKPRRALASLLGAGGLPAIPAVLQAQDRTVLVVTPDGSTQVFNSYFEQEERA